MRIGVDSMCPTPYNKGIWTTASASGQQKNKVKSPE